MVKYEVLFDYGEDKEGLAAKQLEKWEKENQLKSLSLMGITTSFSLKEQDGKKAIAMLVGFGLFIPRSIAENAMKQVAAQMEQISPSKATYRELA